MNDQGSSLRWRRSWVIGPLLGFTALVVAGLAWMPTRAPTFVEHRMSDPQDAPIAIAAATEHRDDPPCSEGSRGFEQVPQRVVGVRIVDDHGHLVTSTGHDLEPS